MLSDGRFDHDLLVRMPGQGGLRSEDHVTQRNQIRDRRNIVAFLLVPLPEVENDLPRIGRNLHRGFSNLSLMEYP